jgi:signal transduction histidine kinase
MPHYHCIKTLTLLASCLSDFEQAIECRALAEALWHSEQTSFDIGKSKSEVVDWLSSDLREILDDLRNTFVEEWKAKCGADTVHNLNKLVQELLALQRLEAEEYKATADDVELVRINKILAEMAKGKEQNLALRMLGEHLFCLNAYMLTLARSPRPLSRMVNRQI